MSTRVRKRAAFESPARLARPLAYDPAMARPATTVAGAVLVLLRVAAGVASMIGLTTIWPELARGLDIALDGVTFTPDVVLLGIGAVWGIAGSVLLLEVALAILVLRGHNWPRVLIMLSAVGSISGTFVSWWVRGQEIRLHTTLVTLALDILILLALSSRSAAAYARRNERR
ncbi:hypothetical protein [Microbacterium sp. SORGH_AS_0888]|uniref:hypothetical protein n=1 Tax=Microbacterium sp. SORGH_AS_0888 TaxID=3041791 RepID=UPI002785D521|nr:hypothetical protein [Microbacterium sp. SORGH_AS_0888]MDQ1129536.1 hypothetical protein [Microbacterium sp. SORGH_AS_0888]